MKVAVIGTGYVGLTTGVALAYLGHQVVGVDKDPQKLGLLSAGKSPIHEPGLDDVLVAVGDRISFSVDTIGAVHDADIIIIAVGTPPKANGEADTQYVEQAAHEITQGLEDGRQYTLVVKSTVPIGTNRRVAHVVSKGLDERGVRAQVYMASNPEFLREGLALYDTFYPDRIVVGAEHPSAHESLHRLYLPLLQQSFAPPTSIPRPDNQPLPTLVSTDPTSAEMIKYSANAFLALKISFINEIAGLCEKVGADVNEVALGIGLDSRIGRRFLMAGLGWGGSCFPKDTDALIAVGNEYGYAMPIVKASREVNYRQRQLIIEKLQSAMKVLRGRTVGVLGLAFKPNTDDVREAPALDIIRMLVERGAHVKACDPIATGNARRALADLDVEFCENAYEVAEGCDGLVLATEWEQFRSLDLNRLRKAMRQAVLVDGRNFFSRPKAEQAGFAYMGVGR